MISDFIDQVTQMIWLFTSVVIFFIVLAVRSGRED